MFEDAGVVFDNLSFWWHAYGTERGMWLLPPPSQLFNPGPTLKMRLMNSLLGSLVRTRTTFVNCLRRVRMQSLGSVGWRWSDSGVSLMKYMGSKRWMLQNGLGHLVTEKCGSADRFVDLFAGTGAVSWHAAETGNVEVVSVDLQLYSAVLARSVIGRTHEVDSQKLRESWIKRSKEYRRRSTQWKAVHALKNHDALQNFS